MSRNETRGRSTEVAAAARTALAGCCVAPTRSVRRGRASGPGGPGRVSRSLVVVALGVVCLAAIACRSPRPQQEVKPAALDAYGKPPRLLSAFFGLDDGLPFGAHMLCLGAGGKDGMPVVLSHTIDEQTLQAEDFRVVTRSGVEQAPLCVTLRPSVDQGERRTVLLIGTFGDADEDPPVRVDVVGDLLSDGATGGPVGFLGTTVDVTHLEAGPHLVLAEVVPAGEWAPTRGSSCPADTRQVIRATWAGGVRPPNGDEAGDAERALYRVTVERADGTRDEIAPAALADLGDNDNNHFLCLDTADPAISVTFPAGHLVDPNRDLNPETGIAVDRASGSSGRG